MKKNKELTKGEETKIKNEIKTIKEKIEPFYLKHEESLATSTQYAWKLGKNLNQLKELNKKLGGKWEKFQKENFPYINKRNAQRYMKLARNIDMSKLRVLALIPIADLGEFISLCEEQGEPIEKKLDELSNYKEVKTVPNNVKEISQFKKLFKKMVAGLNPNQAGVNGTDVMDTNKKREKKGETKTNSTKFISSTNSAANKLLKNFDLLINKQHKNDFSKDDGIDYKIIKKLSKLILKYLDSHP